MMLGDLSPEEAIQNTVDYSREHRLTAEDGRRRAADAPARGVPAGPAVGS